METTSVHAVKRLLHTVLAEYHIVRNTDHLSPNMFGVYRYSRCPHTPLCVPIPVCVIGSGTLCHLLVPDVLS